MPFTLAHPAAVIPLSRMLGRYAVPSALVIGSLTPDFSYFLPLGISRADSHSPAALLWFCLPIGWCAYLLFHLVLKYPLLSLLPTAVTRRLGGVVSARRRLPAVPWASVLVSLLLGSCTHLVWDAFTHGGAPGVRSFGFFHATLFSIGSHPVVVYEVLQHGSTIGGILILVAWTRRWLRDAPVQPFAPARHVAPAYRLFIVAALVVVPASVGVAHGIVHLSGPITTSTLQFAAVEAALAWLTALGIALLVFGVAWHLWTRWEQQAG